MPIKAFYRVELEVPRKVWDRADFKVRFDMIGGCATLNTYSGAFYPDPKVVAEFEHKADAQMFQKKINRIIKDINKKLTA